LADVELLHAKAQTHAFPKHSHDGYAFGVIEQGALGFYYRGEQVVASAGDINLCVPDEPHTGQPAAGSWSYRMFYVGVSLLEQAYCELRGQSGGLPFFQAGRLDDPLMAKRLWHLHKTCEQHGVCLEQQTALLINLVQLISRHADVPVSSAEVAQEPVAVARVKDYLEHHYAHDISLDELAQISQLSRYYLVRVFKAHTGVPPHAYLRQVRVRHAKTLLARGTDIAEVALVTGFNDQSHLTRWFKRLWGYTPAQYRNSLQDDNRCISLG
jgi:AraC-like DNA-binding protein